MSHVERAIERQSRVLRTERDVTIYGSGWLFQKILVKADFMVSDYIMLQGTRSEKMQAICLDAAEEMEAGAGM